MSGLRSQAGGAGPVASGWLVTGLRGAGRLGEAARGVREPSGASVALRRPGREEACIRQTNKGSRGQARRDGERLPDNIGQD